MQTFLPLLSQRNNCPSSFPKVPCKRGLTPSPSAFPQVPLRKGFLLSLDLERGKTPCPSHKYVCSPSPGSQQNTSSLHLAATTTVRFWNPTCPLSLNAYQLASVPSRQIICLDSKKLNKCTPDTTLGTGEVKIRKEGPNLKQFPLGTTKSKGLMLILLSSTLGSPTGPILNLPGPGPAGAHPRAFSQHFSSPCCGHQLLPHHCSLQAGLCQGPPGFGLLHYTPGLVHLDPQMNFTGARSPIKSYVKFCTQVYFRG